MITALVRPALIKIAANFGTLAMSQGRKLGLWGVPLGIVGCWMVYPALPASWKQF